MNEKLKLRQITYKLLLLMNVIKPRREIPEDLPAYPVALRSQLLVGDTSYAIQNLHEYQQVGWFACVTHLVFACLLGTASAVGQAYCTCNSATFGQLC